MFPDNPIDDDVSKRVALISRFKKERFLLSMSEDKFRDEVVRPLFLRQGLKDGRDTCGPMEKGKDMVFTVENQLSMIDIYVVQTKKGSLNFGKKAAQNVTEATTQLKTALSTKVPFIMTKEKKFPTKAILCASGKINENAREHICEEIKDPRIEFMDADDLITRIDAKYPELWFGIDAEIHPYLRKIKRSVEESAESLSISEITPGRDTSSAATDKTFVNLMLYRNVMKKRKFKGKVIDEPKFEEIPLTAILKKKERLFLISGGAGSGKSTSLKRLAYVMSERGLKAEKDITIPVLLRSVDISAQKIPLVEIMGSETEKSMPTMGPSFNVGDLQKGYVTVLIDALDELADGGARRQVIKTVDSFHKQYPKCQVIITSRDYAFLRTIEELKDFEHYNLSPINYHQAEQIIRRLQRGKSLSTENSKEVLRRLQEIHGIELNPLLVTVFAATTDYSRKDIPANITELFKKYTEMMLGRWDTSKGLAQQYHSPLKDFVLKKVAFEMHKKEQTALDLKTFSSIIETELSIRGHKANAQELLDEILNRSGLFLVIGDRVEFKHLLLQEFFAGRGIPTKEFLQTVIGQEWWQRAIVFYFGENPHDFGGLEAAMNSLNGRSIHDIYFASITLGLSIQACYLVEVKDKFNIFLRVVDGLAKAKDDFMGEVTDGSKYPLTKFLHYYLFGRDSVACQFLEEKIEEIEQFLTNTELNKEEIDLRKFWIIVGLIESGSLEEARKMIKSFKSADTKLLLAIHLGCYIIQELRVATREQRKIAQSISWDLSERIAGLRSQLLNEIKSELLEVRHGKVEPIQIKG